jgi:DNA-binding NtrC family response regulator
LGWVATERARLRNALLGLVRPVIEARVRTADLAGALALARDLMRSEPASIEAVELLCDTLVADGRIDEAANAIAQFDPGEDEDDLRLLQRLEQRIVRVRSGASTRSTRASASATENAPPPDPELVGRESDIAVVMQLLEEARAGHRRRGVVTGRAGVGKSRISRALLDALGQRPHIRIREQLI